MKSMHLLEEVEEETEVEEGEEAAYEPEEYNPEQPDLELQYLDTDAHFMEIGDELTPEEAEAEERDLFNIVHAKCLCETCTDWSESFPWKPEPLHIQTNSPEWRPESPDPTYLKTLAAAMVTPPASPPSTKGSQDDPIELFNIASTGLPVYKLEIGPTRSDPVADAAAFIPVRTILDTGAEANYVTVQKACAARAQIFPINAREIVGAATSSKMTANFTTTCSWDNCGPNQIKH
jgi:hypothetical protein